MIACRVVFRSFFDTAATVAVATVVGGWAVEETRETMANRLPRMGPEKPRFLDVTVLKQTLEYPKKERKRDLPLTLRHLPSAISHSSSPIPRSSRWRRASPSHGRARCDLTTTTTTIAYSTGVGVCVASRAAIGKLKAA